jgi:hypothetical protein
LSVFGLENFIRHSVDVIILSFLQLVRASLQYNTCRPEQAARSLLQEEKKWQQQQQQQQQQLFFTGTAAFNIGYQK